VGTTGTFAANFAQTIQSNNAIAMYTVPKNSQLWLVITLTHKPILMIFGREMLQRK